MTNEVYESAKEERALALVDFEKAFPRILTENERGIFNYAFNCGWLSAAKAHMEVLSVLK
jgi:hypothetical protein